jgi:tetratricopeptide (TPR) repeat protein
MAPRGTRGILATVEDSPGERKGVEMADAGDRSVRIWAWSLFGVALLLRLAHLLTIRSSPFFSILYIDPLMYDEWGMRIAGGQLLSERPFFLDPLYAYFLGGVYALFGHSHTAVVAIQSLLGAAVAPLSFLAARRWLGPGAARTAGVIAAIYLPAIYFDGLLMKPGLTTALTAFLLWRLSVALDERRTWRHWLASGVVLGLTCLTRGNLLLVVPLLVLWVWLRAAGDAQRTWRERLRDRRRRAEALGLAAGVGLVLLLPLAHNLIVGGEFIVTTANAGANFYIGNNPANDTGEYLELPFIRANPKWEQLDFGAEARRRSGRSPMTDREISRFWFGESLRWIRQDPIAWLPLLWRKLRSFWGSWEIPDSVDYYLYREYAPVLRLPIPGFGLLAPLALTGALLALARRGWPRLLLGLTAAYSATVILFFVFSRFRMLIAPALYAQAGFAATELVHRARRRQWRALAAALAVLVAFFAFVNLPVRARTDSLGYRIASALGVPTRPETSSLGHVNLGRGYAALAKTVDETGNLQRAERELRLALQLALRLNHAQIHIELGKVLARQRRDGEAIEVYSAGLQYEPHNPEIHHALGLLYRRQGRIAEAQSAFRRALQVEPRYERSAKALQELEGAAVEQAE